MKNFLVLFLALGTLSAYAGPKASCEIIKGPYDNSILKPQSSIVIDSFGEEGVDQFSLSKVETLSINLFDKDEVFNLKATSISAGTKLDFTLASKPEQVKAVFLTDKTPGKIKNSFKALLVITGTGIDFGQVSFSSLVYNLKCKNK